MPGAGTDGGGSDSGGASTSTGAVITTESGSAEVESGDPGSSSSSSGSASSGSAGSTEVDPTGPFEYECTYPNDICDAFSICRCSCSKKDCCACFETECTEDAHCRDGEVCGQIGSWLEGVKECIPVACADKSELAHIEIGVDAIGEATCIASLAAYNQVTVDIGEAASVQYVHADLIVHDTALVDLAGLDAVGDVGSISITENPALTSIAQLGALQRIRVGGTIRDNPLLPATDIHALLDAIEGGDLVEVCGNLDDVDC